jgi:hypothetical protein
MFGSQPAQGLTPRSWKAVTVWVIAAGIFITRPVESAGLAYNAVTGTARWTGYQLFAECGETPPMDWMEPKPCPADSEGEGQDPTNPPTGSETNTPDPAPTPALASGPDQVDDGDTAGAYRIDGIDLRGVLDTGTRAVVDLHNEVDDVFNRGGLTVEVGNPQQPEE